MSRAENRTAGALVYGGVPRAHLMPPEVALRRKERERRRLLIVATVMVLALTVAGVVGAYLYAAAAEARLAEERRTTEQLLATQLEYTEVLQVQNQLRDIAAVRSTLASVEVLWGSSLQPYLDVLAPDEAVESLTFLGGSPAEPPLGTAGPLRQPRVATVTLLIVTPVQPDPARWLRAWEALDTYADASVDSIVRLDETFETQVTINLSDAALSQRFADEEETE